MFIFSRLFVDVNIFDLLTFILELFQDRKTIEVRFRVNN